MKSQDLQRSWLNRVEVLVLLLPHVGWRDFLPWDVHIRPVILGGLHWLQVGGILVYVMNNVLMSTIWDVIPYQHLSHGSWPLCFLIPHLVPINIYLCSLVIFVRVLTTKVNESCSLKSWFMLELTMKTAMLGLDPLFLADGLPLSPWIDAKDSWADSDNLCFLVAQQQYPLLTFLVLFH
jgi:hypothetical protein